MMDNNSIKGYTIIKEIGRGQFGTVFKVKNISNNMEYAMKVVKKSKLQEGGAKLIELFNTEVDIMRKLAHDNILKCYEKIEDNTSYYLILKYCNGGDLQSLIDKKGKLLENEAVYFFKQIMNGFIELHIHKIMHRDFKPANVYLHNDLIVIGDFGFAKRGNELTVSKLGTPMTTAPEIQLETHNTYYTNKVDLWSIGVSFYYILYGAYPWAVNTKNELYSKIKNQSGVNLPFLDGRAKISESAKDLLKKMIEPDPNKRINWNDLFNHKLFQEQEMSGVNEGKSIMFRGSQLRTDMKFIDNKKNSRFVELDNNNDIQLMVVEYPIKPESKVSFDDNSNAICIDRLYHEKKVSNFVYDTSNQLMKVADILPSNFIGSRENLVIASLLLSKKACELNSIIVNNITNSALNSYSLPGFSKFVASDEGSMILEQLLQDNEYHTTLYHKLIERVLSQMRSDYDENIETVLMCDDANINMRDINNKITNNIYCIYLCMDEIIKDIQIDSDRFLFKKTFVQVDKCIHHSDSFKHYSSEGTFQWEEFEQEMNTGVYVDDSIKVIVSNIE